MKTAAFALLSFFAASAVSAADLTKEPTLYLVGYAHLDTQWRWEYPRTIREFLPKTLHDNFILFEKYPDYIFNFSGANRYRLMKEYDPADYERMRQYVRAGRWFPAGSSMEESDVNSPSAESIMRQVLYGNHFFRAELGRTSAEYMLPDCFGFPASLPSLLAHMGIKGFSTQKLTWGSAVGIPFNVGVWEGPDGRSVVAALNPGDYGADIWYDVSSSTPPENQKGWIDWPKRVDEDGAKSGVFADYHYYGTGDTGGAPRESSVQRLESILAEHNPLHVVSSTAEQMFLDITPAEEKGLPRYKGELELTQHSAGSLTSEAYQKRWNRKNELLAAAAERASVAAMWLGGRAYPQQRLNDAWTLVMGGQFHDIAAGTATPQAYQYSWNDDVLAMNQFASVLTSAVDGVSQALDTRVEGTPVVVYNPLNVARDDIVEIPAKEPVRVFGPDGKEVVSQMTDRAVIFRANVPPVGFAVYDIRPSGGRLDARRPAANDVLENAHDRLRVDEHGDVASIFDKSLQRELLSAPIRLAFQTERPHDWPAWNMDWKDQQKPPRGFVDGPATIRVVENGPLRQAIEVTRQAEGSTFVQTIRLAGERIEFVNAIDWRTPAAALKATFPLTASNPLATYNWDVGTIERGNNDEKKYEVASHQWFDLTDASGAYGVTVLSDCKYGSDKPDDNTLRLTLLYTPGLGEGNGNDYSDQATQDFGHHEFVYGLVPHAGDWRSAQTDWEGQRLNQPPIAFIAPKHAGALGRSFSLLQISDPRIRVLALKKAEDSDEIIVRLVELDGRPAANVRLTFAAPVAAAREVNGQEQPLGPATIDGGVLVTSFTPYQLHTFAVKLAAAPVRVAQPRSMPVAMATGTWPIFDAAGRRPAIEMLPAVVDDGGVRFTVAPAIVPHGQRIALPPGAARVHVLAAADGDRDAAFGVGNGTEQTTIEDWTGFIGQWDTRKWITKIEDAPPRPDAPPDAPVRKRHVLEMTGITPGFIKRAPVAWFASHRHDADGSNEPYDYSYLFDASFAVPQTARSITLPDDAKIRIVAITATDEPAPVVPAQPLYDTLAR
ncbi:MAG TPA: glycoside hydrolase family 38 C-terminal domain-containing protein [Thermoanaerobaculia bacterium]|nr:glycoside hydrolase family 38 C-terminal domain-containing protein [Thermoanaerobaculia bacterium]